MLPAFPGWTAHCHKSLPPAKERIRLPSGVLKGSGAHKNSNPRSHSPDFCIYPGSDWYPAILHPPGNRTDRYLHQTGTLPASIPWGLKAKPNGPSTLKYSDISPQLAKWIRRRNVILKPPCFFYPQTGTEASLKAASGSGPKKHVITAPVTPTPSDPAR